jgi:general secretion pathway protein E
MVKGLSELGLSRKSLTVLRDVLSKPRGIVLVTGPAGAGKNTTLYAALVHLAATERQVQTIEDPVIHQIPGIRQTQVRPSTGFTYSTAIRAALRQETDVMMIGEIRDGETAQLALRAAVSGMLVFSTLDTRDSAEAIPRLLEMGLEPYLLASGMVAVIAQRLVRLACTNCKAVVSYPAETLRKVGLEPDPDLTLYRGQGCDACHGSGYQDCTGAFEVLVVDGVINRLIRDRAEAPVIKDAAIGAGMTTVFDDALAKAVFGQTTLEEVLRVSHA